MRTYLNKPMEDLAAELSAGLLRLRKGYVDAAEELFWLIDPATDYPLDFVVFRLTGYRGKPDQVPQPLPGASLQLDLLSLMVDVCESFSLPALAYVGVIDLQQLARRLRVTEKTLQRWRRRELPSRKLLFPDGRRRLAFLRTSVREFIRRRRQHVLRSVRFSQLTEADRADILRRAKRMANFTDCTLLEVSRRIAARTGRAVETIRYTLRRHDAQQPADAVFPHLAAPLDGDQRDIVYRCFLRGVSVAGLAAKYGRTRSSIYRVINEMRARKLQARPIDYMYNPQFDLPNAAVEILAASPQIAPAPRETPAENSLLADARATESLPPYLRSLYEVPLLTPPQERDLFRRYNFVKHQADVLRRQIDVNRVRSGHLRQIETLLLQASGLKNEIVRANLRLVVSIARKHRSSAQDLFELISDGNVSLMKAVEKFDYSRGNRFSTYASWAIMRNFARSIPQERYQVDRFEATRDEVLDVVAGLQSFQPRQLNLPELRESIDVVLTHLSPRERTILIGHYGLESDRPPQTLEQVGQGMGLSKERVRQIEAKALLKLRQMLHP